MSHTTYICELGNLKLACDKLLLQCFTHYSHNSICVVQLSKNIICLEGFDILYGCQTLDPETLRSFVCGGSSDITPLLRLAVRCRPACRRNTWSAWPNSRRRCGPSVTSRGT